MNRITRAFLWSRYVLGLIWQRQEWRVRVVTDADKFEEVLAWTKQMKADGWDDMAAIGNRLYLRRFVPRWPAPAPAAGGAR